MRIILNKILNSFKGRFIPSLFYIKQNGLQLFAGFFYSVFPVFLFSPFPCKWRFSSKFKRTVKGFESRVRKVKIIIGTVGELFFIGKPNLIKNIICFFLWDRTQDAFRKIQRLEDIYLEQNKYLP